MSIYDVIPVTVEDYRKRARLKLPRFLYDYIEGGANAEETLARNTADFSNYRLKQRVMRDVSAVSTQTSLLGQDLSMPVILAPVGMAGMFARRGEVLGAKAASRSGIPFTTSTVGICPVEEVQAATGQAFWFQLYMLRDRDFMQELLTRAQDAGCTTLAFTVDLAVAGMRLRDYRNGMLGGGTLGAVSKLVQLATSPLWAYDVGIKGKPHNFGNIRDKVSDPNDLEAYKAFIDAQFDASITWDDIRWLRDQWQGTLLIKGVMEADDAREAVNAGADGVIVSNHGGRQLDGIASSISKVADVADAIGDESTVLMDGGVRNGIDVVKALALGADAVLVGRPWIYAMAASGEQGIVNLLDVFQREIATAMALAGVNRIEELSRDTIEIRA